MTTHYRFDETDEEIVRLLVEDARRPYSDIADHVGLSPPAVSDRITQLREAGVIRRFTVLIDRQLLVGGIPVLVELDVLPTELEQVYRTVKATDWIEHAFKTPDGTIVAHGTAPKQHVSAWLRSEVDMAAVTGFDIKLIEDVSWEPEIDRTELAVSCVECGNSVTEEGEVVQIDGELTPFCCSSCRKAHDRCQETE